MNKTLEKMALAIGIGFLTVNLLFGGKADKNAAISSLIKEGALIIDTRTAGEFQNGHIEGAVNIPFDIITNLIGPHQTDKSKPIIVYCRSGKRSSHAKQNLYMAGYTNIIDAGSMSNVIKNLPQ